MITPIQTPFTVASNANQASIRFKTPIRQGNAIIVAVATHKGICNPNSITDSLGNYYTLIDQQNANPDTQISLWQTINAKGGICVITANSSNTTSQITLSATEFAGMKSLAASIGRSAPGNQNVYVAHSGALPIKPGDMLLCCMTHSGKDAPIYPGKYWTKLASQTINTNKQALFMQWRRIGSTTGTLDSTLKVGSGSGGHYAVIAACISESIPTTPRFSSPVLTNVGTDQQFVTTADLTNKGIEDVILSCYSSSKIIIVRNFGTPNQSNLEINVPSNPDFISVTDVNHDNFLDLIVTSFDGNKIYVYLNDGTGQFGAPISYDVKGPRATATANFNGHVDIVVAKSFEKELTILRGNGDGTFVQTTTPTTYTPVDVTIADVNNDGIKEIIVVDYYKDKLFVVNQDGSVIREAATELAPASVTTGDFNKDGKTEIAVANYLHGSISMFIWGPSLIKQNLGTLQDATHVANLNLGEGDELVAVSKQSVVNYQNKNGTFIPYEILIDPNFHPRATSVKKDGFTRTVIVTSEGSSQIASFKRNIPFSLPPNQRNVWQDQASDLYKLAQLADETSKKRMMKYVNAINNNLKRWSPQDQKALNNTMPFIVECFQELQHELNLIHK